MTRRWAWVGLAAWLLLLAAVALGGSGVGGPALAPPALTEPATWGAWAAGREPLVVVFAITRVLVVAVAWYLLGVTLVGVVARLTRAGRLVAVADLLTVPAVRRLLQSALGLGLATASLTAVTAADAPAPAPTPATIRLVNAQADGEVATMTPVDEGSVVWMHLLPDADDTEPEQPRTRTVRRGDHFWGIAEQVLRRAWGEQPTDAEIDPYWRDLVAANADRLVDPGNADLLLPGQTIVVVEPPARPRR